MFLDRYEIHIHDFGDFISSSFIIFRCTSSQNLIKPEVPKMFLKQANKTKRKEQRHIGFHKFSKLLIPIFRNIVSKNASILFLSSLKYFAMFKSINKGSLGLKIQKSWNLEVLVPHIIKSKIY